MGRWLLGILLAAGPLPAVAQFSAGVALVEVYATVTDARGEPIRGLTQADFGVEEDGRPQQVAAFASGDVPLALAIAVDRSFSVPPDRLAWTVRAARDLIAGLEPGDEVMAIAIGSTTDVLAPLARDRRAAWDALEGLQPWGTTPLYDATVEAIDAIQAARGRRALILLSDGRDRYSRTSEADVIARARRSDVLVYPVAIGRERPAVFAELASVTGGRSVHAGDARALSAALAGIARELRSQYLIGYTPDRPWGAAREWRSIRVEVNQAGARVRARDGYFTR
jgi:Ca-activated chloride channel family protein